MLNIGAKKKQRMREEDDDSSRFLLKAKDALESGV